ncbi:replication-associated recombination protein A [Phycisphaerales bacterium AB-hyl4]|uniref:Replication-associated recombination protein A n=1 Tax=Natronomicrosphaera hydrolytica TaxID=3242702 RepID=A0ABV4U956_9BACT
MDLWSQERERNRAAAEPLAVRMRPRSLEEFAGQAHFLGPGKMLRRMLEADRLTSVIFYGPPGTGKTTLAELIANYTQRRFERANAAAVGVKDVRFILDTALRQLEADGVRTILFLDEIHRFNRAQQDVLLPDVERGVITLIGATTENPFFAINSPLVSRSQIFQFQPLTEEQIISLLRRAIADEDRGFGKLDIEVTDEALGHWATISDGDARRALAALEIAVLSGGSDGAAGKPTAADPNSKLETRNSKLRIDLEAAEQSIQQKAIVYDATGDEHYDAISAFIKSMRGSDPDAAVYWLARMLEAGEDPRFIARRIAILASEDVGNADPRAIQIAAAAYQITERIGMPECQLTLGQAAIYMATAPKSNASALAIWSAMSDVKNGRTVPVPRHLRDGHYKGAKRLGHGEGYASAHDTDTGFVDQDYLGVDKTYYRPTDRGWEQRIGEYLRWINQQRETPRPPPASGSPPTLGKRSEPPESDVSGPSMPKIDE